jgi:hypothetical protein
MKSTFLRAVRISVFAIWIVLFHTGSLAASAKSNTLSYGNKVIASSNRVQVIFNTNWNYAPTGMEDAGVYRLWWCSGNPDNRDNIWSSTSTDPNGESWSSPTLAMGHGVIGLTCDPSVVKVGSTYYMYFTGAPTTGVDGEIYLATSTDAVNWTKYPNDSNPAPVIPNSWKNGQLYGIGQPSVLYIGGTFVMYHSRFVNDPGQPGGLYKATSSDGINWNWPGSFIGGLNDVDVKYDQARGLYVMVRGGQFSDYSHAFLHTSTDGLNFTAIDNNKFVLVEGNGGNQHCEGPGIMGTQTGGISAAAWVFCGHGTPGSQNSSTWRIWKSDMWYFDNVTNSMYRYSTTSGLTDHFYSLDGNSPALYDFERVEYLGLNSFDTGATPFYRLRWPGPAWHFYTASSSERDSAIASGWISEGSEGYISFSQVPGTIPLYRLYHPTLKDHLYTTDINERNSAIANGYNDEGIAGYAFPRP